MKKIILTLLMTVGIVTARADGYTYLTFETADGAKASVAVESLQLTISGQTLTAGSQTFPLSNVSAMYFSATDETTTGILAVGSDELNAEISEIYDLQGHRVTKEQMRKGVYVVKTKERTYKIVIK